MPHPARPSLTLAIDVGDHHALAAAFAEAEMPPLTIGAAHAATSAALRILVPADATSVKIEDDVQWRVSSVLGGARCLLAKHRADGCGDVWVLGYRPLSAQRHVRVGGFAPVDTATEVAA
jgi:hypothetical protein